MANEMPIPNDYTGLSRKVLQYGAAFDDIVLAAKGDGAGEIDWAPIETLVDKAAYERVGVFLTPEAEVIGWDTYKTYVAQFAGMISWEGTLRHITEQGNRVILELEERNTVQGVMDVSNTVTIYEFTEAGLLCHLDVYVMPLRKVSVQ